MIFMSLSPRTSKFAQVVRESAMKRFLDLVEGMRGGFTYGVHSSMLKITSLTRTSILLYM